MFKKVVISFLLIVIAGLTAAYHTRNIVVEWGIEEGSSAALGVETELGSADLGITAGYLKLNDFEVSNPNGFDGSHIITIEFGMLDLDESSLFSDKVTADSIIFESVNVSIIHDEGRSNYSQLMENIRELKSEPSESQQKFVIKKIVIKDVSVTASISILNQKTYTKSITIKDITLRNVGGDDGATIGKLTVSIVRKIISEAVKEMKNELPGDISKHLKRFDKNVIGKAGKDVIDKVKKLGSSIFGGNKDD